MSTKSDQLGKLPIGKLLREQAIPASIGILILSIYGIVDTIFVGRWIDSLAIGAITVVLPIQFFIASIGMSIGIGGASIISRALGRGDKETAFQAFGNQITLTITLAVSVVILGYFYIEPILKIFGGKGDILEYARTYFEILLFGIPFLAFAMMSNNVIRAEGQPRFAMMIMVIPAISNIILDPIFIVWLDMGMAGAGWATTVSFWASATFALWYFLSGRSEMRISIQGMVLKWSIVKEIFAIGGVTLARQGTIALLAIVLNNSLFKYGGELSISVFGIISRVMMFANFPVLGITQGFLPIAGFNYGAQKWERVKGIIRLSILWGSGIAFFIFICIMFFSDSIVGIFTTDMELINRTKPALVICFLATPLLSLQLIGSAYYQAIGRALPALLLTLSKQGFFLIPLLFILPTFFELDGIWMAFPLADVLAAAVTFLYLRRGVKELNDREFVME
ncbi:MAG: MATE family efflux transporter [Bacteroidota bacterium]